MKLRRLWQLVLRSPTRLLIPPPMFLTNRLSQPDSLLNLHTNTYLVGVISRLPPPLPIHLTKSPPRASPTSPTLSRVENSNVNLPLPNAYSSTTPSQLTSPSRVPIPAKFPGLATQTIALAASGSMQRSYSKVFLRAVYDEAAGEAWRIQRSRKESDLLLLLSVSSSEAPSVDPYNLLS